jgi:D-alanyl-D-alanine dipeptidase
MTAEPMVLLSDPRIAAIGLSDNGESLVDVREVTDLQVDNRHAGALDAFAYLREGAVQRLLDAQATLPTGLRLLIVEGYRQMETQRSDFDGYGDELRSLHPDWSADRLFVETSKFASPVEVAPHSTGGAIDLTLCTDEGASWTWARVSTRPRRPATTPASLRRPTSPSGPSTIGGRWRGHSPAAGW